jgi:flagellar biosynthesis protein FlgN
MLHTAPPQRGPAPDAAAFAAGLQAEQDALGNFIRLLQAEQDILVRGDADGLAALAPDKAAQLDLLSALGERRKRCLAAQDLADSADGMRTWFERIGGSATPMRNTWQELLARAKTAQRLNQSNGALIENQLQQNRLKLAVLQSAAASDGVYRRDGQLRPLRSARPLDQA